MKEGEFHVAPGLVVESANELDEESDPLREGSGKVFDFQLHLRVNELGASVQNSVRIKSIDLDWIMWTEADVGSRSVVSVGVSMGNGHENEERNWNFFSGGFNGILPEHVVEVGLPGFLA